MLAGMAAGAADGDASERGGDFAEPGVLRDDRDRGRVFAVRPARGRRRNRPGGPRNPRRRHGEGVRPGADPAVAARGSPAGQAHSHTA
jgi:hypothetical protein